MSQCKCKRLKKKDHHCRHIKKIIEQKTTMTKVMKGEGCSESTKLTSYADTMDEKESSPLLMKKIN
jgi:hypothetical protein